MISTVTGEVGDILYANSSAQSAFPAAAGQPSSDQLSPSSTDGSAQADTQPSLWEIVLDDGRGDLAGLLTSGAPTQALPPTQRRVRLRTGTNADSPSGYMLHLRTSSHGYAIVQLTADTAVQTMAEVVDEQHRFRTALMELSELADTTEDDDDFYQRLIERAVDVVPGAQAGSVQLNIPGTATFRFVAAVGYDLAGLQMHDLDQSEFFRDALDPGALIVRDFSSEGRSPEIAAWLDDVGRLSEMVVNVSAPVIVDGLPVAFLALDNYEDPDAMTETSIEMTTVLGRLIGDLWRRRDLEAEVRKEREAFRHQALHDPLTALPNRRSLERLLTGTAKANQERDHSRAVLFVDIDDFKGVNDRLGHEIGDLLLMAVANELSDAVRTHDFVGRWGGDEFLVVPSRVGSAEEALELAHRLLARFENELLLKQGLSLRARMSVGVGWSDDHSIDGTRLVRAADEALYQAKAAGKGTARLIALDT